MFDDLRRRFGSEPDKRKNPLDQEIELANWSAVENLYHIGGRKMLERWVEIVKKDLSPMREDGWFQLNFLYTELDGKWPTMDPITKVAFLKYARRKLAK